MHNEINNLVGFDRFYIDTNRKILWIKDEPVDLPIKAIEVLCVLIENEGEVVSKDALLDQIWRDSFVEESTLSQNIYRLRKAFEEHGADRDLIQTIPRRGYRFAGQITETLEEEISIERESIERQYIVKEDASQETASNSVLPGESAPVSSSPQSSRAKQSISIGKSGLMFAVAVLAIVAVGTGFWFWTDSDSGKKRFGLVRGSIEFERITESGRASEPAISRDNKNIAYVYSENNTAKIVLQNVSTGSETVIVEPQPFELGSLNFSADGNHLYYIVREDENPDSTVYQVPIFGGTRRKILTNVRHFFSISPGGKILAFFRYDAKNNEYHLVTSSINGSDENVVSTRKPPDFFRDWNTYPAWSPDGQKLVVSAHSQASGPKKGEHRSYLIEIDVRTGAQRNLKHPDWDGVYQAFWVTDGTELVVSAREKRRDLPQLWSLSYPDGTAKRITNDTNHYREFKLAFDSSFILAAKSASSSDLYIVSIENPSAVRRLTDQNLENIGRFGLDWTRDGNQIVYVKSKGRSDGSLWKIDVETGEEQQLTFNSDYTIALPRVMPDGKSVVFGSTKTGIWHIWQVDLDGDNLIQITKDERGARGPEVSSDGKWLFYGAPSSGPVELWKTSLVGAESSKILLTNAGGAQRVSPVDSEKVVFSYFDPNEKENQPWKYGLISEGNRSNPKQMKFNAENHSFWWDTKGTGIFYPKKSMNQNNVWFEPISDGDPVQITRFVNRKVVNLSVSPNGKSLALSREEITSNILKISGF